jgi:hypothetical protein
MAEGFAKIYGIILSVFPLYFIIYDLIYKYKLSKHEYIDDNKLINSYFILENSISIIVYFIINVIFMRWFISTENIIEKLILSPFCLCLLCALGLAIAKAFDKKLLESIFKKLYIVIFLIYWFGMLIYFTISIIKLYKFNIMLLLTIPFWLAGFYILYKLFINKSSKGDE